VPAPAVIPAPRAYINVVAVKKLVVGFRDLGVGYGPGMVTILCGFPWFAELFRVLSFLRKRYAGRSLLNWMVEAPSEFYAP